MNKKTAKKTEKHQGLIQILTRTIFILSHIWKWIQKAVHIRNLCLVVGYSWYICVMFDYCFLPYAIARHSVCLSLFSWLFSVPVFFPLISIGVMKNARVFRESRDERSSFTSAIMLCQSLWFQKKWFILLHQFEVIFVHFLHQMRTNWKYRNIQSRERGEGRGTVRGRGGREKGTEGES